MRVYLTALLSIAALFSFGQSKLSTKSKKAAEYYYQADNYRVRGQYGVAMQLLQSAILKDDEFHEAYFRLGVIYKAKGLLNEAEELLLKADALSNKERGSYAYELGELFLIKSEYEQVAPYVDRYLESGPRNERYKAKAIKIKGDAQFALANTSSNSEFKPHPLSDTVNAFALQYFPVITIDQNAIIFTRRMGTTMQHDEDLVISRKTQDGSWGYPETLSENINSEWNEGTCTLSADGRTLIFTSCYGRKGYGSCDLYVTQKIGGEWTNPLNLGNKINSGAWESQPSLSADGRTLYFVSNRGGGIGGRDIWMSTLDEEDNWQRPTNMGKAINTIYDEVSPFIHPNNSVIYYASDGLQGFGGFDIFYAQRDGEVWGTPQNIGNPINTSADQVSLVISPDGLKGYYSNEVSNDPNQKGRIYEFDVPQEARVGARASYISGKVLDADTKLPLKAYIELFNLQSQKREAKVYSDSVTGEYLMALPEGAEYALYVNKENYLFESKTFFYKDEDNAEPISMDVFLTPVRQGAKTILKNIYFDHDSYTLKEKSKTEISKLIKFLEINSKTHIEIGGYTDDTGSPQYNEDLSLKRAKTVYDYLINRGVQKERLSYKGYGQNNPAFANDSDDNRQRNRRIEFKIIK